MGLSVPNIGAFRNVIRDISRSYLFMVRIPFVGSDTQMTCFARSASLPSYNLQDVEVKFQAQTLRLAGPANFEGKWQLQFLCDEAHAIRHKFLGWMSVAYDPTILAHGSPSQYKDDRCEIHQLDRTGASIAVYRFVGLFPSEVGNIELNHDSVTPEQFQVTLTYDYWVLNAQNPLGSAFLGLSPAGLSVGIGGGNAATVGAGGFAGGGAINGIVGNLGVRSI